MQSRRQKRRAEDVIAVMCLFRAAILITFPFLLAALPGFGQASTPKAAMMAFYKFDGANSQVFSRANIDARRRWLSEELYKLLLNELEREKAFLAKNPADKPHFGDGLPFRPLDETCTVNAREYGRSIAYGSVTIKGELANVDVYFKYPKACDLPDLLYAVNMSRERGRWVIDDIRYIGENTSLVQDLQRKEY